MRLRGDQATGLLWVHPRVGIISVCSVYVCASLKSPCRAELQDLGRVRFSLRSSKMKNLLKILWLEQNGQDLTEYALLLGLLALGAIASIGTIAKTINNVFANADFEIIG
jgi:Flp pilus assembly pilin Flp